MTTPAAVPGTPDQPADAGPRTPLVFGGVPEAEGFAAVPITARVRVHFRVVHDLPLA